MAGEAIAALVKTEPKTNVPAAQKNLDIGALRYCQQAMRGRSLRGLLHHGGLSSRYAAKRGNFARGVVTGTRGLRGATVKVFGIGRGGGGASCGATLNVAGDRSGANFGETRLRKWVIAVVAGTRLVREFWIR